jgi:hypothetical protein
MHSNWQQADWPDFRYDRAFNIPEGSPMRGPAKDRIDSR